MKINIDLDSFKDGGTFLEVFEELFNSKDSIFITVKGVKMELLFVDGMDKHIDYHGRVEMSYQLSSIKRVNLGGGSE